MPSSRDVPVIREAVVCIVDRESIALAAVISSYFSEPSEYFPLFTFPGVEKGNGPGGDRLDDDYVAQMVGREAAVTLKNILAHLEECETLVLAGLTDVQRSYIDTESFGVSRVLTIASPDEVDSVFRSIGIQKEEALRCHPDEVLRGLYLAKQRGWRLWVADDAEALGPEDTQAGSLVVVEQTQETAGGVVAVNYAHAIGAAVRVVDALPRHAESRSVRLLQRWREDGEQEASDELNGAIAIRVGGVDFSAFDFVTFFTEGLPYSLIVDAVAPCSYVHLGLFPDRFIVNAIIRERSKFRLASAVVFAIEGFHEHDETLWLTDFLQRQYYAVRPVIGSEATVEAFDYHAADFPYDFLHISSHGGEVDGSLVAVTFDSRDGERHVIEYDEVVGIARTYDGSGLFNVQHKAIFKTLDGLEWGSAKLRERDLPDVVYVDAMHAIFDGVNVSERERSHKEQVPGGCAIVCNDGYHMAMFRTIAAYGNPIIFNNTCSSWSGTNHFFLSGGAIAYIGTHWNVPDDLAIDAAKTFYKGAIGVPLIDAIHRVNLEISGTADANIYAFWGLHFSTLTVGEDAGLSVNHLASRMAKIIEMYARHLEEPLSDEVRDNAARTLRRVLGDFDGHFTGPHVAEIKARAEVVLAKIPARHKVSEDDAEGP